MNLLNIKTGHCICKTNIGYIILDLRSKKLKVYQPQRIIERDFISMGIELLTSENWLPLKDLDYFDIAPRLKYSYLEEKFGNYFKNNF